MRDGPIILSAPMVRALLDGRKTQTRRLASSPLAKVRPGDWLWVRECGNWSKARGLDGSTANFLCYAADAHPLPFGFFGGKKRPSIHMPRWASRITLAVEGVRFQQLQDISEADAAAEGGVEDLADEFSVWHVPGAGLPRHLSTGRDCFALLWDRLHGSKPGEAWADNPAVVALTFRVHRANIDALQMETARVG